MKTKLIILLLAAAAIFSACDKDREITDEISDSIIQGTQISEMIITDPSETREPETTAVPDMPEELTAALSEATAECTGLPDIISE